MIAAAKTRLFFAALIGLGSLASAADRAPVVVGDARFTVVTPHCIRMEYVPGGQFVDEPSLFAANRLTRSDEFVVTQAGRETVISTSALCLRYRPDGDPFSAANLTVDLKTVNGDAIQWTPGAGNPGNLGGTVATLDRWDGAGDLGQGLLSRDGWAFVDDSRTPLFTAYWVKARPDNGGSDGYLFAYGSDYHAALKSLAAIGGSVPMPRKYVLGSWYSRYWPYTAEEFRAIVKEYADHDFPLDMLVLDMDWHEEGWTGYTWNRKLLPDPKGLLDWIHEQGIHVTLNDHPADGVQPHESMYRQFMRKMNADPDSPRAIPFDAGSKTYLDAFYDTTHRPLDEQGCDFWWLDWQQYPATRSIPELTNLFWLNDYYYKRSQREDWRGQIFSRWGGWGSHRYPIQFSGDASTTFTMLAFEVPFTATAGNVGCYFWSHDIGGHVGARNPESYARWCQFGATTAALRSHSTRDAKMDRRPWTYDRWAENSIRRSFHLRSELMPYIYTSVHQTSALNVPLTRPMYFAYPTLERAYHSPQQYLLGDHLLVAPIASEGKGPRRVATQVVWFPPGDDWYNILTGERYPGGTERLVAADIDEFPLYVRAGVPLPLQPYTPRMAASVPDTLVVRVYPVADGVTRSYTLYEDDGISTAYKTGAFAETEISCGEGETIELEIKPTSGSFSGQPQQRAAIIELGETARATGATVNGEALDASAISYDESTRISRITLPSASIREGRRVSVTVAPLDARPATRAAQARRSGIAVLADAPTEAQDAQRLAEAIASTGDSGDRSLLLNAFGIGVVEKNESTYGWPAGGVVTFYAPAGLIDGDAVSFVRGEEASKVSLPRGAEAVSLAIPRHTADQLPGDAACEWQCEVRMSIGGVPLTLPAPAQPVDFREIAGNVAPLARVSASTATRESPAAGIADGTVGGYPGTRSQEWSSDHEGAGGSLTLAWDAPQTIDRVWLFDRQNPVDQVLAGELVFDDGSRVPFGELPNGATSAGVVAFPARATTSLQVVITRVSPRTENTGLAEVVVLKAVTR